MSNNTNYGLNVLGNIRVFTKSKTIKGQGKKKYNVTDVWFNVSEKQDDGSYINKSMNIIQKKGSFIPSNNTVINIVSGRLMLTGSGDYTRISLFVEQWEEVKPEGK